MTLSAATKAQIRLVSSNAGDASGNADSARWAMEAGDLTAVKWRLEWCLEQANLTATCARVALEKLAQEGGGK